MTDYSVKVMRKLTMPDHFEKWVLSLAKGSQVLTYYYWDNMTKAKALHLLNHANSRMLRCKYYPEFKTKGRNSFKSHFLKKVAFYFIYNRFP